MPIPANSRLGQIPWLREFLREFLHLSDAILQILPKIRDFCLELRE